MTFAEFKQNVIAYLKENRDLVLQDIADHESLSDQEKEEEGYAIFNAEFESFVSSDKQTCILHTPVNNTRWRIGDSLRWESSNPLIKLSGTCYVESNSSDSIILTGMPVDSDLLKTFNLKFAEPELLSLFIRAMEPLDEKESKSLYLKMLGGVESPKVSGRRPISIDSVKIPSHLNEQQRSALENILKRPSLYTVQGPPGTGKTDLLASIANSFSKNGAEVLVISNTHYAVNNALNKIAKQGDSTVVKIGNAFKAHELDPSIKTCMSMNEYNRWRSKNKKRKTGDIVGMSLCGALINLGLIGTAFTPSVVLVDEASQIPLAQAAALGTIGASTYVYIGDDRQMPPIFHSSLNNNSLSISIFEYLQKNLDPSLKSCLSVTYRMNAEICRYISHHFYEPYGLVLSSHESISGNHVLDQDLKDSIEFIDVCSTGCEDFNSEEALEAVSQAIKYKELGLDVAVVTPYRKQVNLIREEWEKRGYSALDLLVDTVERLQGQDVDVIILSFSVSDADYLKMQNAFLLNKNRLNVMISRAKVKVVVIKHPKIHIA